MHTEWMGGLPYALFFLSLSKGMNENVKSVVHF